MFLYWRRPSEDSPPRQSHDKTEAPVPYVSLSSVPQRDEESGELKVDTTFGQNMKDAVDAGLNVGIWFYSEAANEEEVMEEAQMVIEAISGYDVSYPVVFVTDAQGQRAGALTKAKRTELALQFCHAIAGAGY